MPVGLGGRRSEWRSPRRRLIVSDQRPELDHVGGIEFPIPRSTWAGAATVTAMSIPPETPPRDVTFWCRLGGEPFAYQRHGVRPGNAQGHEQGDVHGGDPPLAGDDVADLDHALVRGLRAMFGQEVSGEPMGGSILITQQSGCGDHDRAGRAGGHPGAPRRDGSQPVEQWLVRGGASTPDPTGHQHDVGVLDVGKRGVDPVAAARTLHSADASTHTDQIGTVEPIEHAGERLALVGRHPRVQRQRHLHRRSLPRSEPTAPPSGLRWPNRNLYRATMATSTEIDRDALRAKYREERDKRLRSDGNEQYVEVTGLFEHYVDDPHVEATERDPLSDDVTVAFIGGGFAGLITGAKLHEAGIDDVRIIEKGGDFGGTWYWNRYPGAQCDTAAFVYLPLLEETGHMPSEKYTHGPEILDHSRRIGHRFDLYDNAVFSTEVTSLTWDDEARRWIIRTNRGDEMRARFVAMGTGPLHRPKLPGIPGIETYQGHSFHTSRWDYDYTGGDANGAPLDGLADKRVGIIGTGATAVQCIPHLARSAKELFVFQRTPSSIDVRNNHDIDPDWFKELKPGWQAEWLMNFTTLQTGGFADEDLVKDGWTDISQRIRDKVLSSGSEFTRETFIKAYEDSDDEKMSEIRERVDSLVTDASTAEALKPWYRQLCKRPCFHDEYLDAYNQPGTHLIDTNGKGAERIDQTGVWANGEHYDVDCLIYASGFEVGTELSRRSGFETAGRGGEKLSEHWDEGMQSLHGIHVHGFPNLFLVTLSHAANLISNVPHNYLEAGATIAAVVDHALQVDESEGTEVTVEVTADAERAWVELLEAGSVGRMTNSPDCTPGYYNNEGQSTGRRGVLNSMGYPEGPVAYFQYIDRWRSSGDFDGLEFQP